MLVLQRKIGERILIDGGICIEVVAIEGRRVRLGIDAPRETTIVREEIATAVPESVQERSTTRTASQ